MKLPWSGVLKSVVNFKGNTLTALNVVHKLNISNISSPCSVYRSILHTTAMRWFAKNSGDEIGKKKEGVFTSDRIVLVHYTVWHSYWQPFLCHNILAKGFQCDRIKESVYTISAWEAQYTSNIKPMFIEMWEQNWIGTKHSLSRN